MLAVERAVYLTIDDGPAGDFKQKAVYLNSKGIRAIWFCLGEALEGFADEVILAIKSGHVIGNRSYNNADFSVVSLQDAREQIERTDRIINELYAEAEVVRPYKAFRFPYMEHEASEVHFAALQGILEELGYGHPKFGNSKEMLSHDHISHHGLHVPYTLDTFDLASIAAGDGEIIKLHDWIGTAAFAGLIDKLIAQGISFQLPPAWNTETMLTASY
jgi:peptidoglycan/xylan/chitin deacetylase (PgdA/CDA1 family)